jgi:hypothetical protein
MSLRGAHCDVPDRATLQRGCIIMQSKPDNAAVQLRLGPIFKLVEDWRRAQPKIPQRSEAIRQLIKRGLEAEQRRATAS